MLSGKHSFVSTQKVRHKGGAFSTFCYFRPSFIRWSGTFVFKLFDLLLLSTLVRLRSVILPWVTFDVQLFALQLFYVLLVNLWLFAL
jgi:hypothetical protein